jgi:hypothetical protein
MVQVDVFWSYGIGAGFAVANTHALKSAMSRGERPFDTRVFRNALFFLAVAFAPSGVCLLWAFPDWETMHVGDRNLPAWLVTLFAATNITQGALGYWVASRAIERGRPYIAFLQWLLGYFGMFAILVHGWDGTGYQRFFSPTAAAFAQFTPATIRDWFVSDVAITLGILGIFIVPPLSYGMARALVRGYRLVAEARRGELGAYAIEGSSAREAESAGSIAFLTTLVLFVAVGLLPATAVLMSLAIRGLGVWIGLPAFALVVYAVGLRPGGVYHRLYERLVWMQPLLSRSAKAPRDLASGSSKAA